MLKNRIAVGITGKTWKPVTKKDVNDWISHIKDGKTLREIASMYDRDHRTISIKTVEKEPEIYELIKLNRVTKNKSKRPTLVGKKYNKKKLTFEQQNEKLIVKKLTSALMQARRRAELKNLDFQINICDLMALYKAQGGKCLLTGLDFSLDKSIECRSNPFVPSIDRVKPNLGYTRENIRLVCWIINKGIGEWGLEVYETVAQAYIKHRYDNQ